MGQVTEARVSLDELYRATGRVELVGGELAHTPPMGFQAARVAGRIFRSLDEYAELITGGLACGPGQVFVVHRLPSGRESFAPAAAYTEGPRPAPGSHFLSGPPAFAAEVRGEAESADEAETERHAKRADYFLAGTRVVWDVDPTAQRIQVYRAPTRAPAATYAAGQVAEAEPAVSGWRLLVTWAMG